MDELTKIFNLDDQQPEPKQGALLVAKPTVDDLCFKRSVILLISNSEHSSMGLIVNHQAGYTLNEAIPGIDCEEEIPLYLGGPVDTEMLFYIHTLGPDIIPDCREVANGIYVGGSYDAIKEYVNSGAPVNGKVKFIIGYSGWSAGQLNDEIAHHDWAVSHFLSRNLIMREGEDDIWKGVVASFGEKYRLWLTWPNSIILN